MFQDNKWFKIFKSDNYIEINNLFEKSYKQIFLCYFIFIKHLKFNLLTLLL